MDEHLIQTTDPLGAKHGSSPDYYYEWALTAFYLAYIAFEWLSLLWTVIPAHVYVSGIVLSWGVIASLQAVAGSYPWLIRLRFLLGIGEAGFTGIPIYLSFFFRREEMALRTAVFISGGSPPPFLVLFLFLCLIPFPSFEREKWPISNNESAAAPLATTFASSLAWLIIKLGENGPIAPWRLLFLVEGFPAVIVATLAWRIIPDSPGQAWYLTKREKEIARQRLLSSGRSLPKGKASRKDNERSYDNDDDDDMDSDWTTRCCESISAVLLDPVPWITGGLFFLSNVAYSSLPVFLPSILTQMGHSPLAAQALAAPPYLVSFFVVLAVAAVSDALQSRAYLIAASALCSATGYAFLALSEAIGGGAQGGGMLDMVRYLSIYPAAAGFFCVVVLTISWNVNNARGEGHKGGGFAVMQILGQCGPLLGVRLFPKTDGPWFTKGMGTCAGAMLGVAGLAMALRWHLARKNWQLEADEDGSCGGNSEEEEGLVGTSSDGGGRGEDGFRYML